MKRRKPGASTTSICGSNAVAALLVALALTLPLTELPEAHAEAVDAVKQRLFREEYDRAESAYSAKNYQAAVPRLQAAYAIEPVTQILFNIAQAYRKLYLNSEARVYYELYRSTAKELPPEELAIVDRHIADMRDRERAAQTPKVVEKTRLLYLQSEKPPPRWLRPVGLGAGISGLGGLGAGIALLALHDTCTGAAMAPALECPQVYNTRLPGAVVAVAGGGLVVLGVVLVALSARRPAKPVVTETRDLPSEDELLPLLPLLQRRTGSGSARPSSG